MATGLKNGVIKIWDIREQTSVTSIANWSGEGSICSLNFSEKGINFAAAWKGSETARVFDLRKMDKESFSI
jgi:WD40 repeat protein